MRSYNLLDLLSRLKGSIDSTYNVTDMKTLIEVFSAFEQTSFAKKLLEDTALVSLLIDICQKTKDKTLFFCARNLIRKWRLQIGIESKIEETALKSEYFVLNNLPTTCTTVPLTDFSWNLIPDKDFLTNTKNGLLIPDSTTLSHFVTYVIDNRGHMTLNDAISKLKREECKDYRKYKLNK